MTERPGMPIHQRQARNLPGLDPLLVTFPPFWFDLIWTPDLYQTVSTNTNKYAALGGSTTWKDTTPHEISIWIGFVIYMGLYRTSRTHEYWSTHDFKPTFPAMRYMSRNRWMEIKRNLYICDPAIEKKYWYEKVTPLSDPIFERSRYHVLPATRCSVDEMMFRFTGRSRDKTKAPHKPIPEGYEVC